MSRARTRIASRTARLAATLAVLAAACAGAVQAAEVLYPARDTAAVRAPAAMDTVAAPRLPVAPPAGLADSLTALRAASRGVDYLWVLRDALIAPSSIDSVVARASRMGVRGLLVQVVGRGDAYYASALLPRAEPLGTASDADPLAHLIARAHAVGLEVHAWMNCMLVWSADRAPRDPRHVVRAHPEWIAELPDGRRTSALRPRTRERLRIEGAYLAPARPAVRQWVASIAAEIASRYAVDGVHLDYIRQPDVETGYDPDTRARFALVYGADPARFDVMEPARRAELLPRWRAFQHEQVTAVVRAVRDTLRAVRPGVALSAAVVSDPARSNGPTAQDWRAWVRDTLVDRAYVMCYTPEVQAVMDRLVAIGRDLGATQRVVPGIAVYNTSPVTAAVKLRGARALGFPLLALYSYDSLFTMDHGWARLERGLGDPQVHDDVRRGAP